MPWAPHRDVTRPMRGGQRNAWASDTRASRAAGMVIGENSRASAGTRRTMPSPSSTSPHRSSRRSASTPRCGAEALPSRAARRASGRRAASRTCEVGSYGGAPGGTLRYELDCTIPRPPNDDCSSATVRIQRRARATPPWRMPRSPTTTPGDDRLATGRSDSIDCCVTARERGARNSLPRCDLLPARVLRRRRLTHRLAQRDRAVEIAEVDAQQKIAAERLVRGCGSLALAEVQAQVPGAQRKARGLSGSPTFRVRRRARRLASTMSTRGCMRLSSRRLRCAERRPNLAPKCAGSPKGLCYTRHGPTDGARFYHPRPRTRDLTLSPNTRQR
jgi:hypothetical protein